MTTVQPQLQTGTIQSCEEKSAFSNSIPWVYSWIILKPWPFAGSFFFSVDRRAPSTQTQSSYDWRIPPLSAYQVTGSRRGSAVLLVSGLFKAYSISQHIIKLQLLYSLTNMNTMYNNTIPQLLEYPLFSGSKVYITPRTAVPRSPA